MSEQTPAYEAGYKAAQMALQQRKGNKPVVPGRQLRNYWEKHWTEFITGWSQAVKDDKELQASWNLFYEPRPYNDDCG